MFLRTKIICGKRCVKLTTWLIGHRDKSQVYIYYMLFCTS